MEVDVGFFRTRMGALKVAQMVLLSTAFVCFSVASMTTHQVAAVTELLVTSPLLLLRLFQLHKKLTFFFWPLVDLFHSAVSSMFFMALSVVAVSTSKAPAALLGGVFGFAYVVLQCAHMHALCTNITLNRAREARA